MKINHKRISYYVEDEGKRYRVDADVGPHGSRHYVMGAVGIHNYCRVLDEDGKTAKRIVERLRAIVPPADLKTEG